MSKNTSLPIQNPKPSLTLGGEAKDITDNLGDYMEICSIVVTSIHYNDIGLKARERQETEQELYKKEFYDSRNGWLS